jgi:hypothetical protein
MSFSEISNSESQIFVVCVVVGFLSHFLLNIMKRSSPTFSIKKMSATTAK